MDYYTEDDIDLIKDFCDENDITYHDNDVVRIRKNPPTLYIVADPDLIKNLIRPFLTILGLQPHQVIGWPIAIHIRKDDILTNIKRIGHHSLGFRYEVSR